MNILIVGNIIKDTFLEFETNLFERGDDHQLFLDLCLDEEALHFKSRKSLLGGACIVEEILNNFGHDGKIQQVQLEKPHCDDHRYIIKSQDCVKYLTAKHCARTHFLIPKTEPDWIFIDRSARLEPKTVQKVTKYLGDHGGVKLAIFFKQDNLDSLNSNSYPQNTLKTLIKRADLLFATHKTNKEIPTGVLGKLNKTSLIYQITPDSIQLRDKVMYLKPTKQHLTHLTTYSIVAGTLFAATVSGWNVDRTMKLAKINLEYSQIGKTLTLEHLHKKLKIFLQQERDLQIVAKSLVSDQKGILAIDESKKTIKQKFHKYRVADTEENQLRYREILTTTPKLSKFLNGIILAQETITQKIINGQKIPDFLTAHGILPGVKADLGLEKIPFSKHSFRTLGLENLEKRLGTYFKQGLRFVKWRTVFSTDETEENKDEVVNQNTNDLVEYTKKAIQANLVPILEPEVLCGEVNIDQYFTTTKLVLTTLFKKLSSAGIDLSMCILKINMIYAKDNNPLQTGRKTVQLLLESVPRQIGGIVFLSGEQNPVQATENLHEIIQESNGRFRISFSFGRAIQDPALAIWNGDDRNIDLVRQKLQERLTANCRALTNTESINFN